MRSASPAQTVKRAAAVAVAVVAVVLFYLAVTSGSRGGHRVFVTVPEATGVLTGQKIRSAGSPVGQVVRIDPANKGRAAKLELKLDDSVWPLPKGSSFLLRWSGTINEYNRYIALTRGPDGPQMVGDGGTIPASAFKVPVEYGQLLTVFTKKVRGDLKTALDHGGTSLDNAKPDLRRTLTVAPPALDEANHVLSDLDDSGTALNTLVDSTNRVVTAANTAEPGLGQLVQGAGQTFAAVASQVRGLQSTLDAAPATFAHVRSTLKNADPTLKAAQSLTDKLGPGVTQLRAVASPLNGTLTKLRDIAPDAETTLSTANKYAPNLTSLVNKLGERGPELASIGKQAIPQLDCIRPYTPEIAAFATDWGSSFSGYDGIGKYIRANPEAFPPIATLNHYDTSGDEAKQFPGLKMAFPRPPGYVAGQPWFLPQCGITEDSLDPSKDPEAVKFNPADQIPELKPNGGGG